MRRGGDEVGRGEGMRRRVDEGRRGVATTLYMCIISCCTYKPHLIDCILYFLDFFPRVLLISVPARMQVQSKGGNKTRTGSILLGSACSLECEHVCTLV